jgi:hypothetical protein
VDCALGPQSLLRGFLGALQAGLPRRLRDAASIALPYAGFGGGSAVLTSGPRTGGKEAARAGVGAVAARHHTEHHQVI